MHTIVFEGIDGSGKSTLSSRVETLLVDLGLSVELQEAELRPIRSLYKSLISKRETFP